MTNAMPDGVDGYHRQMADRERRGEEPGFKSHASKPDHPTPYRVRECAACGDPCPPGRRWCSMSCFHAEDRSPDDGMDLMVDGDHDE